MAGSRLVVVRVGDVEVEAEAVAVAGTEPTSGRMAKATGSALEAFGQAQDVIVEVAKSTAAMLDRAGAAARPDRLEVEFGLKFSASGGVIMAGVAGEASLKVTLSYEVVARSASAPSAMAEGTNEEDGEGATVTENDAVPAGAAPADGVAGAQ